MAWERDRYEERRGGESYRPSERSRRSLSRGHSRHTRSPLRNRSPRLVADTWAPPASGVPGRTRSRSPSGPRIRSRSPTFRRQAGQGHYGTVSPRRRVSPRRDERPRSPPSSWRRRFSPSRDRSRDGPRNQLRSWRRESSPHGQDLRYPRRDYSRDTLTRETHPARRSSSRSRPVAANTRRSRSPPSGVGQHGFAVGSRPPSVSSDKRTLSAHQSFAKRSVDSPRNLSPPPKIESAKFRRSSRSRSPHESRLPQSYGLTHPSAESWKPLNGDVSGGSAAVFDQDTGSIVELGRPNTAADGRARTDDARRLKIAYEDSTPTIQNAPSQPRSHSSLHPRNPPSGPSHASRPAVPVNRGSTATVLTAPTQPRHGLAARDSTWPATPAGRFSAQIPPLGPRSALTAAASSSEASRYQAQRSNSLSGSPHYRNQRPTNHLVGLPSIIPGGKALPSGLDPVIEKRLAQLEADEDRLAHQALEQQWSKRTCLKDWERLDRENSISTLRSELAEGHLQRMADREDINAVLSF